MSTNFREILVKEGLKDWKIRKIYSGGGVCIHSIKEIWIDEKHWNLAFLLHEIAHAVLPKKHLPWHDVIWGDKYTELCEKYFKLGGYYGTCTNLSYL